MPNIVHFEIPADNTERARQFYGELFGWTFEEAAMGESPYWVIQTEEGGLGGGLLQRQDPHHLPTNYISVESVDDASRRVEELGGKIVIPKQPVPGMGWFAACIDTEGNGFSLWQENAEAA